MGSVRARLFCWRTACVCRGCNENVGALHHSGLPVHVSTSAQRRHNDGTAKEQKSTLPRTIRNGAFSLTCRLARAIGRDSFTRACLLMNAARYAQVPVDDTVTCAARSYCNQ
jgi:hypothetical protein